MADNMAAVKHYNWLLLNHFLILRLCFFTELCAMTLDISSRSLTQIRLQSQDGKQNGGRARMWLYLKRLCFISCTVAYCIASYASFYAGLSCYNHERCQFLQILIGCLLVACFRSIRTWPTRRRRCRRSCMSMASTATWPTS